MSSRGLIDTQWVRLHPLLPPQKPHTGRPARDRHIATRLKTSVDIDQAMLTLAAVRLWR